MVYYYWRLRAQYETQYETQMTQDELVMIVVDVTCKYSHLAD